MKENMTSKDMRFNERIYDAQKHLVPGTDNFIDFLRNQGKLFESVCDLIINIQMMKKIEFY